MVALSVTPPEEATYTTNLMTEPERLEGVPGRYWHRLEDGRIQRDVCCVLGAWGASGPSDPVETPRVSEARLDRRRGRPQYFVR